MVVILGRSIGLLVVAACTLAPRVARAEPFHEAPPDEAGDAGPPSERWYGWQTLSVDALPAGLFAGALATDDDVSASFWFFGAATFAFGAPVVHVLHDRPLIGLASFGLRVALPAVGLAVGSAFADLNPSPDMPGMAEDDDDPYNGALPFIIGGLIGVAGASALDAAFLAYDPLPRSAAKNGSSLAAPFDVSFALAPRGGRVAVLGTF